MCLESFVFVAFQMTRLRLSASMGKAMRKRTYLMPQVEQKKAPLRSGMGMFFTSDLDGTPMKYAGSSGSFRRRRLPCVMSRKSFWNLPGIEVSVAGILRAASKALPGICFSVLSSGDTTLLIRPNSPFFCFSSFADLRSFSGTSSSSSELSNDSSQFMVCTSTTPYRTLPVSLSTHASIPVCVSSISFSILASISATSVGSAASMPLWTWGRPSLARLARRIAALRRSIARRISVAAKSRLPMSAISRSFASTASASSVPIC